MNFLYKTIIIDDEKNALDALEILLLKNHPSFEIVAKFNSSISALEYLLNNNVDLVFSDIQMPLLNGIELFKKIQKHNFFLVYTTAYDQYALEAIKLSAMDYLLKPIDEDELAKTLIKFSELIDKKYLNEKLVSILKNSTENEKKIIEKIPISFQDKINLIKIDDIIYCESNDNYTTFYLLDGSKILSSKTIKFYEEQLQDCNFIRPHQSYVVNKKYIESYNKKEGGGLVLINNIDIPVSRQKKELVLELFKL
jgi:two-component system LytT family response regulator